MRIRNGFLSPNTRLRTVSSSTPRIYGFGSSRKVEALSSLLVTSAHSLSPRPNTRHLHTHCSYLWNIRSILPSTHVCSNPLLTMTLSCSPTAKLPCLLQSRLKTINGKFKNSEITASTEIRINISCGGLATPSFLIHGFQNAISTRILSPITRPNVPLKTEVLHHHQSSQSPREREECKEARHDWLSQPDR